MNKTEATADSSTDTPLAIIGIGCLFPQAVNRNAYWANIRDGLDAITEIPSSHWQLADYYDGDPKRPDRTYGQRGGFLSSIPFNPMEFNIPPNTLEAIDTSQLLGLVAAGQALKDAGYGPEQDYDRNRVSVILGVTGTLELVIPLGARLGHPIWRTALKEAGVDESVAEDVVQRISDSYVPWQENSFPGLLGNVVAGRISKQYDLGGTNCVVDAACASSFSALHLASLELAAGKADMVVTGGIDTFNDIFMYMCFSKTPALSPTGNAKPFDAAGDGTILGEGLGLVVVKRLSDAERDGDAIYAVIRGVGSSSDGKGEAIYAPSAAGQKKALLDAYRRTGVAPETIGMVEAHGTGTKVGDAVEVSALREVYGEAETPWCALGSVKSQIGHTKAAAGAAGLIKAALALHHKVIPPTIKVTNPLEEVTSGHSPFYLATEKRPWLPRGDAPRRAAVSAFGFGGSNFHVVLEEHRPEKETTDWDGNVQILAFSGTSAGELVTALASLPTDVPWHELRVKAAATRAAFDGTAPCRLTLAAESGRTNLAALVGNAVSMLRKNPAGSWQTPEGAFYATGTPGQLGIVFPGQGSQYPGMLRDLACAFPEQLATLATADEDFPLRDGMRLSDIIYPIPAFDAATRQHQEQRLRATDVAQPAIGAVSLGALRVLESFGVAAGAYAGHSYGELTALCAAGRIDEAAFHRLSRLRGSLMASGEGDKGGMLAVSAPLATVEQALAEEKLDLVIANRNAPSQAVLSGRTAEIDRAAAAFAGRGISCTKLPVAAAFHSSLVADAAVPFHAALADIAFAEGVVPVYANTTASPYPTAPEAAKELLAGQLARPVEFVAEVEAMYAAGIRTFVEVGPGARLSGIIKAILGERDFVTVAVDSSAGKRPGTADLARALAQLAALGHGVRVALWDGTFEPPAVPAKKPAMTVPLCGANYVKPRTRRAPAAPRNTSNDQHAATPVATPQAPPQTISSGFTPAVTPAPSPASQSLLAESLRATRESMALLQKMQEETAHLHRRFLEGQETAARTFQSLLEHQQRILSSPAQAVTLPFAAPQPAVPTVRMPAEPLPAAVQMPMAPAAAPAPAAPVPHITETLLVVISEKTGYPVEMLDLDMGMESDLGIDSIKRVEILSALHERLPGAPAIGPDQLGTLRTLGDIAGYLGATSAASVPGRAETAAATPVSAPVSIGMDTVAPTLIAVISEKTGYPTEMLDLDMSMESDLGIDSIKRVEILSALQERLPGAPVIGPEHLGTLRTLGEIARHLGASGSFASAPSPAVAASGATASASGSTAETLLTVVSEKTGYPVDMLDMDMTMEADLGIDSIKRVEILSALHERLPHAPVIGPEHLGTLRTLGEIARHLDARTSPGVPLAAAPSTASVPASAALPAAPASAATIGRSAVVPAPLEFEPETGVVPDKAGEFWIAGDGSAFTVELGTILKNRGFATRLVTVGEPPEVPAFGGLAGVVVAAPTGGTDDEFLEDALMFLKATAQPLRTTAAEGGALCAVVSRLDGTFGCGGAGTEVLDPLSGGLTGLVKTAAREWPEVTCKAIDLGGFPDEVAEARAVADELFRSGPLEIGLTPASRSTLALADLPQAPLPEFPPVREGDVVIITGGGRGVTAETAVALAQAYRPFLVLLGRSPEPAAEPTWLAELNDESRIKRALLDHAGEKLHPREIEERYQAVVAGREIRSTLERISAAGGTGVYLKVNLRQDAELSAVLQDIRAHGPVRGIVHGAGVLADRLITEKTREQFSQVYGTKIAGFRSLLNATAGDDLRFIALFSSTTARFGRTGQADYAIANEVLNKLAQVESRRRTDCHVVSINWGPWDGGMVTPALKKVFAKEGVGLIGLAAGSELLVREIADPAGPVEVVVLAGKSTAAGSQSASAPIPALAEAFSLTLSVNEYPFLRSHVLDGKAVVPMAMIVEWLSHGALHGNPGFRFHGFNDLRICKGVVFEADTPCTLQVLAGRAEKRESFHLVPIELHSIGKNGSVLNARAEIVLATRLPEGIRSIIELPATPYVPRNGKVYDRERLFHGPDLHGIVHVDNCSAKGIAALVKGAPAPATWIKQPLRSVWLTDPLVIDSAFQLMILWSFERFGAASLPCFAGRYRQFHDAFPKEGVQVVIRVTAEREHGATADVEFLDRHTGKLVARLEGYECVIDASLGRAFQRNELVEQPCVELGAA